MTHRNQIGRRRMVPKALLLLLLLLVEGSLCQLPEDIQQELDKSIAEQARIDAIRRQAQLQQQQQLQQRSAGSGRSAPASAPRAHDPNNYSYQQVSPPIQYSYYQPFGDAAPNQQQPVDGAQRRNSPPVNIDLNNFNLDDIGSSGQQSAPSSSGQPQQPSLSSFTAGPTSQPIPSGQAPLAPQARVQQGPPLTEADFKDITGGENYGAPGGSDFGLGAGAQARNSNARQKDNSNSNSDFNSADDQLREFGMPGANSKSSGMPFSMGAFGDPSGASARQDQMPNLNDFGSNDLIGANGRQEQPMLGGQGGNEFDFASQPSSQNRNQDQLGATSGGSSSSAPSSLQSLLGAGFPGLGGGGTQVENSAEPRKSRQEDNSMEIANLGDRSDQFSGADLGSFEQPGPQNDQDFNFASASNQQPKSVPYPDGSPQPVGTLLALTQPQMLGQTRYNALPDKGTYQDYPAYASGGNDFSAVASLVDATVGPRQAGPGRYSRPSSSELAPEYRHQVQANGQYDYSRGPTERRYEDSAAEGQEFDLE